jgi:hypothetical protein
MDANVDQDCKEDYYEGVGSYDYITDLVISNLGCWLA